MKAIIMVIFSVCLASTAFAGSCVTREDAPVARTKSDFNQMVSYEGQGNQQAITRMANQGRLFIAAGGRTVQRLGVEGRLARISYNGETGYTFNSFLICK